MYQEKIKNFFKNNLHNSNICSNPKDVVHLFKFIEKGNGLKVEFETENVIKKYPKSKNFIDFVNESEFTCQHVAWCLNRALNKEKYQSLSTINTSLYLTSTFPFFETESTLKKCTIVFYNEKEH